MPSVADGDRQGDNGPRRQLARRVGFWLGLALFAILMLTPAPESMRRVARAKFADELPADVTAILHRQGIAEFTEDSPVYRAAVSLAIRVRARAMMSAAAVTALVACWWITVAAPLPVTSLLPLVLFPMLGILRIREAAVPYADPNVFLFMGGFMIALGIQRWDLHRRIALHTLAIVGTNRSTIVLGFMVATAGLSMWISNTATTMMMLPIGMAVITALSGMRDTSREPTADNADFAVALMLGVAYAASVGGVATPIGTPPNIVLRGQLERLVPHVPEISFGRWMLAFVPFAAIFLPIIWLVLVRVTCRTRTATTSAAAGRDVIHRHLKDLGPLRGPARAMLLVFGVTILLWITRTIPAGHDVNYGWAHLVEKLLTPSGGAPPRFHADNVSDATIALGIAVLLFVIPAGRDKSGNRRFLMDWDTARQLPWGILLLFGGGFALASGFEGSGLSLWCGQIFAQSGIRNPILLIAGTCLMITFLTEITSNTATTQVMLPILAQVSRVMGLNPLLLMLPATISASCAFMLPVATPPNAIVFGTGCVPMNRMVRTGILLNLIGVVLVSAFTYLFAHRLLGTGVLAPPS
jgi:sodium-dependent dicarboxylate transporter 2/3/5